MPHVRTEPRPGPQFLTRMSIAELAEFYEGLRVWAPFDVAAQQDVAEELCRRVLRDDKAKGAEP